MRTSLPFPRLTRLAVFPPVPSQPSLSRARVPKLLTGIAEIFCFSLLTAATDLPAGAFLWFDVLVTVSVLGLVLNIIFLVAYYMEQGP